MTNWSSMRRSADRDWYLADSLIALGNEINARWPNRDTRSDGAVGDASHQARASDHNPDYSAGGVVRAIDIDSDGINVTELLNATIGDDRVWYVIWDHYIYSRTYDWRKRSYDGADPHTGHLHISINHNDKSATDVSRWFKEPEEITVSAEANILAAIADLKRDIFAGPRYQALQDSLNAVNGAVRAILPALKTEDVADDAAVAALNKSLADLTAIVQAKP